MAIHPYDDSQSPEVTLVSRIHGGVEVKDQLDDKGIFVESSALSLQLIWLWDLHTKEDFISM